MYTYVKFTQTHATNYTDNGGDREEKIMRAAANDACPCRSYA